MRTTMRLGARRGDRDLPRHFAVSHRRATEADCVALWTRDFRTEADAGRPSIARAIIKVMDDCGPTEHIVLEHRLGSLRSSATLAGAVGGLLLDRWPLQTILYSDPVQRLNVLERLRRLRPRTVYLDTVRCLAFARDIRRTLPKCRLVLDMDDLLSRRLETWRSLGAPLALGYVAASAGRLAALLSAEPARSLLLRYEIGALCRVERLAMDLTDAVVLTSPHEASLLGARAGPWCRATIVAVPPSKSLRRPLVPRAWPLTFVFIGSDGLLQNRVTIDRLIELWRCSRPASRLEIFGSMQRHYAELPPGVQLRGFATDLDEVYAPDRVLLAPSYVPGGIKTKVLEAFAHGCPVIGNAAAFEGLDLANYPLVCADDAALAALVNAPETCSTAFDVAAEIGRHLLVAHHTEARFAQSWCELLSLESAWPADAA
jgi:glycosyltransferase involved in cell wall biosynthesis